MSYSQNKEDLLIGHYFRHSAGRLLSLGENDGTTFSNARALIEEGWLADLVEPAPGPFAQLSALYQDHPGVRLHNVAVGETPGRQAFFDSGTLLNQGDHSLVSTLVPRETERWGGTVDYHSIEVDVITVQDLLKRVQASGVLPIHFISIDCEGMDLYILRQLDLDLLDTRCLCVEFNGKDEHLYYAHMQPFGFRLLHKNAENLIYVR